MTGRIYGLLVAGWSLFACSPSAAQARDTTSPPTSAAAPPATSASASQTRAVPKSPAAPAEDAQRYSCAVDIEIRDADRARGTGTSDSDPEQARKDAWKRACAELNNSRGLDCEDETRVRVVRRSSSTSMSVVEGEQIARYEQVYELVGFREASGIGRSARSRADACQIAADNACQATLGAPCPADRVSVLRTDQATEGPVPPRNTI